MSTPPKTTSDIIGTSLADPAKLAHNLGQVYERMAKLAQMMAQNPDTAQQDSDAQTVPMATNFLTPLNLDCSMSWVPIIKLS